MKDRCAFRIKNQDLMITIMESEILKSLQNIRYVNLKKTFNMYYR